jgi:hypothetical protein
MRINLVFTCKYTLSFDHDFVFVEKYNFLVNKKTGRILKQITKGGSIGYVLKGKFHTLTSLRQSLVKIAKPDCPF